ncbi:aldo-keto reductase [Enterobacter cancerogenus]|uniref:Aldo-keto reductase n=1 Tax=Enterobacter cancerogenus TaxID=69218 RepID=A0A484YCQ2_9ENTR|nr:aldo-keto reductase [Enterobacter cancerogenus]
MSWHPYPGRYENMQYRFCGQSGLRLPALSLGLWHSFWPRSGAGIPARAAA